jgi:hypothetical protein
MKMFGGGVRDETTYLLCNVSNVGTQQTTITHVAMFAYKNLWMAFRNKPSNTFIINHAVAAYPIPYVLQAGHTFMSMAVQDEVLEKLSRESLLFVGIIHSFRDHPEFARVRRIVTKS